MDERLEHVGQGYAPITADPHRSNDTARQVALVAGQAEAQGQEAGRADDQGDERGQPDRKRGGGSLRYLTQYGFTIYKGVEVIGDYRLTENLRRTRGLHRQRQQRLQQEVLGLSNIGEGVNGSLSAKVYW